MVGVLQSSLKSSESSNPKIQKASIDYFITSTYLL